MHEWDITIEEVYTPVLSCDRCYGFSPTLIFHGNEAICDRCLQKAFSATQILNYVLEEKSNV